MKYFICTTLLILSFSSSLIGQVKSDKVEVLWGPETKEAKRSTMGDLIAHDKSGIMSSSSAFPSSYVSDPKSELEEAARWWDG